MQIPTSNEKKNYERKETTGATTNKMIILLKFENEYIIFNDCEPHTTIQRDNGINDKRTRASPFRMHSVRNKPLLAQLIYHCMAWNLYQAHKLPSNYCHYGHTREKRQCYTILGARAFESLGRIDAAIRVVHFCFTHVR